MTKPTKRKSKNEMHCDTCNVDFTTKDKIHFDHDYTFTPAEPINLTYDVVKLFIGDKT